MQRLNRLTALVRITVPILHQPRSQMNQLRIKTQCACGKSYTVQSGAVGKRLTCRACNSQFICQPLDSTSLPSNSSLQSPQAPATKACESCGELMPNEKIVCTSCDYSHRTKKKVKRTDPLAAAEKSKVKARNRAASKEKRQAKSKVAKSKTAKKKSGFRWGFDWVAISSGGTMILAGLAILAVGLVGGRIIFWGGILVIFGFFSVVKGLIGEQGIW